MKLIRFGKKGNEKPGVLLAGERKDCSAIFRDWDRDFFNNGGLMKLEKIISTNDHKLPTVPKSERWGPCIARPGVILCIGLNYADHAKEAQMDLPLEPLVFGKASNTIHGPYDDVILPKAARKVDYEIELAVVLKRDIFELKSEKEAEAAIAGYCAANDLSERVFQLEKGGQWIKGKSAPGFCPLGPYLQIKEEGFEIDDLWMRLEVNGELRQNGSSRTMVFKPAHTLFYLSQFMRMEAGDVILTGTPPGVAMGMNPPTYLKDGDVVELSIQGLGSQKTLFLAS